MQPFGAASRFCVFESLTAALFDGGEFMRKLTDYKPTQFMAENAHYDKDAADYAVGFH